MRNARGQSRSGGAWLLCLFAFCLTACVADPAPTPGQEDAQNDIAIAEVRSGEGLPNAPTSEAEWQLHAERLRDLAVTFGVAEPEPVEVVRWVMPEEIDEALESCVNEKGFSAEGGLFGADSPPEQASALNQAMYECLAAYPPIAKYNAPYTEEQIGIIYDWTVEVEIPCLEAQGYEIAGTPSRLTFISDYQGGEQFFPFSQLPPLSNEEFAKLEEVCPQMPPTETLFP